MAPYPSRVTPPQVYPSLMEPWEQRRTLPPQNPAEFPPQDFLPSAPPFESLFDDYNGAAMQLGSGWISAGDHGGTGERRGTIFHDVDLSTPQHGSDGHHDNPFATPRGSVSSPGELRRRDVDLAAAQLPVGGALVVNPRVVLPIPHRGDVGHSGGQGQLQEGGPSVILNAGNGVTARMDVANVRADELSDSEHERWTYTIKSKRRQFTVRDTLQPGSALHGSAMHRAHRSVRDGLHTLSEQDVGLGVVDPDGVPMDVTRPRPTVPVMHAGDGGSYKASTFGRGFLSFGNWHQGSKEPKNSREQHRPIVYDVSS